MARRNWKWEKTITYPLVSEAQDCKKDVSNGYQYLELQCIWSSTKCNAKQKCQTQFGLNFQAKSASQNDSKSSPKGSRWRPESILEASWEAKLKRRRFLMPRGRLKDLFGEPFGSPKSFQTCPRSVSTTEVTSKGVLERFSNPLETNFECFFLIST